MYNNIILKLLYPFYFISLMYSRYTYMYVYIYRKKTSKEKQEPLRLTVILWSVWNTSILWRDIIKYNLPSRYLLFMRVHQKNRKSQIKNRVLSAHSIFLIFVIKSKNKLTFDINHFQLNITKHLRNSGMFIYCLIFIE